MDSECFLRSWAWYTRLRAYFRTSKLLSGWKRLANSYSIAKFPIADFRLNSLAKGQLAIGNRQSKALASF
jgi:hypothetical protein